jgi:hypothetical protein
MRIPTITFFKILPIAAKIKSGSMPGGITNGTLSAFGPKPALPFPTVQTRCAFITAELRSPGLWGIESDAGDKYFEQVFQDEREILIDMLASLKTFEMTEHPVEARPG